MVNPSDEITLAMAAELLPRRPDGRKVHVRTIQRWIEQGCRGVYLSGRKAGNTWFTTPEAIEQFRDEQTAKRVRSPKAPTLRDQKRMQRETRERLKAKGFKLADTDETGGG